MRRLEATILLPTSRHFCTLSPPFMNHCLRKHATPLSDRNPTPLNIVSWNKMLADHIRNGQTRLAHNVFDEMPLKDVVSWNTMLSCLHKSKDPQGVHHCFMQMRRDGFGPNEYTISIVLTAFMGTLLNVLVSQIHALAILSALNSTVFVGSALMKGYANVGDRVAMGRVFDEISGKDVSSWNALISSYVEFGCMDEAQIVFDGMVERNVVSWTSLVNGYIRNRRVDKARSVFDQMSGKNVVSWTVMISGYVKNQRFVDALELFHLMLKSGTLPNHFTFSSVLDASAGCSSLIFGQQVHSRMLRSGIPEDVTLSTSLVDMYAKCGDIDAAYCYFGAMLKKNLVTWNSIIGGYARHGYATRALEEFERMTNCGVRPDAVTFTNVLSACAHGGMIEEGKSLFNLMKTKFRMEPQAEHYACMVDLYGKAGELEEAKKLIEGMPFQPDVVIWCALLGACGLHSSLELGEFAAKELDKLESDHPAIYSTLLRIHGEREVWNSVLKLRNTMNEKGVQKQNAGSWVESAQAVRKTHNRKECLTDSLSSICKFTKFISPPGEQSKESQLE